MIRFVVRVLSNAWQQMKVHNGLPKRVIRIDKITTLFKSEVVIRMVNVLTMSAVRRHAMRPVMEVWIASLKSIGAEKSTALRKSGIDQPNNNYTYNRINQRRRNTVRHIGQLGICLQ